MDDHLDALLAERDWAMHRALRLTRDRDAADDLIQETYLRLLDRPVPSRPLRPYLAIVMRNLHRNRHRGRARRLEREACWARQSPGDSDTVVIVEAREARRRLALAVAALPAREQLLLSLRYTREVPSTDIAEGFGEKPAAVRSRLRRIRTRLRNTLEP